MKAGWEVKSLGEVVEIRGGGTPSKQRKEFWGGDVPWVSPKDMKFPIIVDSIDKTTEEAVANSAAKHIPTGAILIVVRSGILSRTVPIAIAGRDLTVNQDIKALLPNPTLDANFLAYFLEAGERSLLGKVTRGATVHKIDTPVIKALQIPIPPLEEQKRIVAVLDAAFEGLTRATEHAEANLQNARELFEEAKDEILTASDGSWFSGTLEQLVGPVSTGPFGSLLHKSDYVANETPIVNPAHIINGRILPDMNKTIGQNTLERLGSYIMKTGDIVFGRRGDMGRCATVSEFEDGWLCGTGSFYIRPKQDVEPELVSHLLRSRSYVKTLESLSTGATMLNISNKTLAGLEITLPPVVEQLTILEKINELEARTDHIKQEFVVKLTDISDLRQSLLQKAFAGELT